MRDLLGEAMAFKGGFLDPDKAFSGFRRYTQALNKVFTQGVHRIGTALCYGQLQPG